MGRHGQVFVGKLVALVALVALVTCPDSFKLVHIKPLRASSGYPQVHIFLSSYHNPRHRLNVAGTSSAEIHKII